MTGTVYITKINESSKELSISNSTAIGQMVSEKYNVCNPKLATLDERPNFNFGLWWLSIVIHYVKPNSI